MSAMQSTSSMRSGIKFASSTLSSLSMSSAAATAFSDHNASIVIDMAQSSGVVKVGFAGEACPRHVVAYPSTGGALPFPTVGSPLLSLTEKDWEGLVYPICEKVVFEYLLLKNVRNRRVIVLEPYVSPQHFRVAISRCFLKYLNVPALLFIPGGDLNCVPYALPWKQNKPDAPPPPRVVIVINVDAAETRVVCCTTGEGGTNGPSAGKSTAAPLHGPSTSFSDVMLLSQTFQAVECSVAALRQLLRTLLLSEKEVVSADELTTEDCAALLRRGFAGASNKEPLFALPSHGIVTLSNQSKLNELVNQSLEEIFWNVWNEQSLMHAFLSCLSQCPIDYRREAVHNIVIIGSHNHAIPQFERRFMKAVRSLFGSSMTTPTPTTLPSRFRSLRAAIVSKPGCGVLHPLPFRAELVPWIGAAVMATVETTLQDERWIHRDDFLKLDGGEHSTASVRVIATDEEEKKDTFGDTSTLIYDFLAPSPMGSASSS